MVRARVAPVDRAEWVGWLGGGRGGPEGHGPEKKGSKQQRENWSRKPGEWPPAVAEAAEQWRKRLLGGRYF